MRKAGRWPHGEEMLHEALAETYIPLLNALYELKEEGSAPKLTLGLTPILAEQLADPSVLTNFDLYLMEELETAQAEVTRYQGRDDRLWELARFYRDGYAHILQCFQESYRRDITGAFCRLQEEGYLDILTSAATHAYLPLMERDATLYGQLRVGAQSYRRHFGRAPKGIWLPECGYRPAYYRENGPSYLKPGVEEFLSEARLGYFFTETHVITGGKLMGKVAGDVLGPYGGLPKRKLVVREERPQPVERTTFRPYCVESAPVAVFGRNARTGLQVWSAAHGYPGDPLYREFHRKDATSGLQYWRVTGAGVDLGEKDLYNPTVALQQAMAHARHFVFVVTEELRAHHQRHASPGIVVSAYDTELFGHWWYEGVAWLKEVLRLLAQSQEVGLATAGEYLEKYPPQEALSLAESSWGEGGAHWTWLNPATEWMWPLIHNAERQMEGLIARHPQPQGTQLALLNQVARELVLLEASDWPFLITTGQAKQYASGRFQQHLARFNHLSLLADAGRLGPAEERLLAAITEQDNPFPDIDYRHFAARESAPQP